MNRVETFLVPILVRSFTGNTGSSDFANTDAKLDKNT
jgi:hypothetical protein